MENFQLLRTNILLGGQMGWDLILDTDDDMLVVSDFHLSPININTPKYSDEYLLNYRHQDNLKAYYKQHESIFYDTNINPKLSHDWVVLGESGEEVYEDSFEAGAKNANYQLYKKPIEILCPIWLEQLKSDDELIIKINVYSEKNKHICSKAVSLTNNDKFGEYFKSYISYLGLNNGVDDVLNIDLSSKIATITGISLDSGNIVKQDVSYIVQNLLHRERPMMEFDSMLINLFANNHIITRQLFNFNLCLDMNDLLSKYLTNMVYGSYFRFETEVYINETKLELVDFYSNYEFIQKENTEIKTILNFENEDVIEDKSKLNVLNYLLDYEYIDYITKNKYVQNIIHWSLNDNSDYLFNMYNGFGPYNGDDFYSHKYGNTPDLLNPIYNSYSNNIGWCNAVKVNDFKTWLEFINSNNDDLYNKLKSYASDFKYNWVNKVKYDANNDDLDWDEFKLLLFLVEDDNIWELMSDNIKSGIIDEYVELANLPGKDECGMYYIRINNLDGFMGLIVHNSCINDVTFVGINNILNNINNIGQKISEKHPLMYLKNKFKTVKHTPVVSINKSLFVVNTNSPSTSTTEIEYYKDDNASVEDCYVLRYDGKIKPTFISKSVSEQKNYKYYKKIISEQEFINSDFNKYVNSKFPPKYPSINYCALNKSQIKYDKWDKNIIILIPEISVKLQSQKENGELKPIKDIIKLYLKQLYNLDKVDLIYDMYNVESSYYYKFDNRLDEYEYDVKLILK